MENDQTASSAETLPLKCDTCGKPAACIGRYEHHDNPWTPACHECCGHGCEDGKCYMIADMPATIAKLHQLAYDTRATRSGVGAGDLQTPILTCPCGVHVDDESAVDGVITCLCGMRLRALAAIEEVAAERARLLSERDYARTDHQVAQTWAKSEQARASKAEAERDGLRKLILDNCTPARDGSWPCYHHVRISLHAQWREENNDLSPILTPAQALDAALARSGGGGGGG